MARVSRPFAVVRSSKNEKRKKEKEKEKEKKGSGLSLAMSAFEGREESETGA